MPHLLRAFDDRDAPALATLTCAAIRSIGARAYSPAQVEAWAERAGNAGTFRRRAGSGQCIFVAADADDRAVAYAVLTRDGHLNMLYCHPDHAGRGLAGALLAHCEHQARRDGLSLLFTEASEVARAAFEHAGYTLKHRRDFTIEGRAGAISIHNYAMEKRLD
jgi:putative acetyltransferase